MSNQLVFCIHKTQCLKSRTNALAMLDLMKKEVSLTTLQLSPTLPDIYSLFNDLKRNL